MNTNNIKKAILFRWMYSIFVSKDAEDKTFSDKRAVDILNKANFNIPYNKDIKPFLKEVTSEFREAMKKKEVDKLLEKYPIPKEKVESDEEIPLDSDSEEEIPLESDSEEEEYYKEFKKGDTVVYIKTDVTADILEVHKDDFPNIYYTIKTEEGKEIQTEGKNLIDIHDSNEISDLRDDIEVLMKIGYNYSPNHIIHYLEKIYTVKNNDGENIVLKHIKKIKGIIEELNDSGYGDEELYEGEDKIKKLEDDIKTLKKYRKVLKSSYISARKSLFELHQRDDYMRGYTEGHKYGLKFSDDYFKKIFENKNAVKYNDSIILKESYFNELQNKAQMCNNSSFISRDSKEYLVLKEIFKNSLPAHQVAGTEHLSTEQKFHPSIMEKYYNAFVRR
jgi:hypothetical protein